MTENQAGQAIGRRPFAVLNPRSGSCTVADVRRAIEAEMDPSSVEIHEVVEGDDIRAIVRDALARGRDPIIAAGGDGTVSTVADVLVGTEAHLVVYPLGTANVLARELGIPVELDGACRLGAEHCRPGSEAQTHSLARIDAMKIDGHHYLTQVGVGIDSLMIRDTGTEQKRRFGRLAYLATAASRLVGFRPRRFKIAVDGREFEVKATQVLVANTGMMGHNAFRWGPDIRPDDGRFDICIVRARTVLDYLGVLWHVVRKTHKLSPHVRYEVASRSVVIDAKHPLPVQADGEILGTTPVRIEVVPLALNVVIPATG
jgi:YegS/Rv2252/BmrU family lipid kinase